MDRLLPGFRFYPTEEELIDFYLLKKLHGRTPEFDPVIPSIDIYNFEPSQLPGLAGELCDGDTEQWFFFVPQQEREARGGRPNRTTATGYWKATGSTSLVHSSQTKIGVKKTMVFYKGKAPTGRKTKWKMNEYKAIVQEDTNVVNNASSSSSTPTPKLKHEMRLCRVYVTSGCARAFDRRPMPGTTTTTTLNTSVSTQNEVKSTQVEQGIISAQAEANNKKLIIGEKSNSSTATHYYTGNSSKSNSWVHGQSGTRPEEGSSNNINNDIHMSDSVVDYSFMDWDQLGWI